MASGVEKNHQTMKNIPQTRMMMIVHWPKNNLSNINDHEVKVESAALPMMVRTMAAMSEGAGSI